MEDNANIEPVAGPTADKTSPEEAGNAAPRKSPPASMSMVEPRLRSLYLQFYKESYFVPSALDLKTKELIAIGVSLASRCEGCLEGHLRKALELGITKEEISDAIVVAIGIAAASVMDFSDKAAIKLDLRHFE